MTNKSIITKLLFLVILVTFLGLVYSNGNAKDVPLSDIEASLLKIEEVKAMSKNTPRQLNQFLKLDANSYEEVIYYRNQEALNVEELLIVKAKDKSQIQGVQDAVDSRIELQIKAYEGYGPKQVALLKDAKVFTKGKYLVYCVSKKSDKIGEVIKDAI